MDCSNAKLTPEGQKDAEKINLPQNSSWPAIRKAC